MNLEWRKLEETIRRQPPWLGGRWDVKVFAAMASIPRERFAAFGAGQAYVNAPFDIGENQTISQPTIVAIMTQALELTGAERVLEVGTGCGYQTAILSQLAKEVYSIERVENFGPTTSRRLRDLEINNTHLHTGDGAWGLPAAAPFDRILVTAAPASVPLPLAVQLAPEGILVIPVGAEPHSQQLLRIRKGADGRMGAPERLGGVRFVPMLEGLAKRDDCAPGEAD